MSKQQAAALAGAILGALLAGSAAPAQSSRTMCTPQTIGAWLPKVEAICQYGPLLPPSYHEVISYALPTESSSPAQSDRTDRFLDMLLARLDNPEPLLRVEYPATNEYEDLLGTQFYCGAAPGQPDSDTCRPAEAVFLSLRTPLHAWVGLGPNGPQARVILPRANAHCPQLVVNGLPLPMSRRLSPADCFDVTVCTSPIPHWATSARIGGVELPVPRPQVRKIAILGDTGCRLKASNCPAPAPGACRADCEATSIQACNDPGEWPFAAIADSLAQHKPDLVIHVGDYSYREAYCPPGNPHCAGSPWGDNWPSWKADFFDPAAPLLAAAPWVFVRGNHEDCTRAHKGWFYFLDPAGFYPETCNDDPAPYAVTLPGLQLLVLNTSSAGLEEANHNASFYASAFTDLNQRASEADDRSWLLSHHPLWAFVNELTGLQKVLQDALRPDQLDRNIEFTVAGHIHFFEALGFSSPTPDPDFWRPPGGVFGMGGTSLDQPAPSIAGKRIDEADVTSGSLAVSRFGYALAERSNAHPGWDLTAYTPMGDVIATCRFGDMELSCTPH